MADSKLVFTIPDLDTPGYLTREKKRLELAVVQAQSELRNFSARCDWLLAHISEPRDPESARDALMDCTQRDYLKMLVGLAANKNPKSSDGTGAEMGAPTEQVVPIVP